MTCANCDYWAFTSRGNNKATCQRCGKVHRKTENGYEPVKNQLTTVRDVE